jgi:CRP-like cAMP-binding protein
MIQEELMLAYGGTFRKYQKGQCIFFEGDEPCFYYQLSEVSVRIANVFSNGKEFIQGIFKKGESFGEPVLLVNAAYPATAIANVDTTILKIKKENFIYLLKANNYILFQFTQLLSQRLLRKSAIAREISGEKPLHRVITLLTMLKKENGFAEKEPFEIQLSRQRIADMVGLRVETVIRAMKKMAAEGVIIIKNGKAYI